MPLSNLLANWLSSIVFPLTCSLSDSRPFITLHTPLWLQQTIWWHQSKFWNNLHGDVGFFPAASQSSLLYIRDRAQDVRNIQLWPCWQNWIKGGFLNWSEMQNETNTLESPICYLCLGPNMPSLKRPVSVILMSIFALTPAPIRAYSRLLPLTPAHADAQISTGEWQKTHLSCWD